MTAVSTEVAPRRAIGELPPEIQQALDLRKSRNLVAAQIAGMSWGEKLDGDTRRAVAAWGQQFRIDVTTEIHVLGGRVYRNADFYLRRLGEMAAEGLVEYAVADHVEDDPRLKELGPEGEGEYTRRLRERIMHAIPDKAVSSVVFRVKLRSMDREVVGCKWCGGGTRKNDPVGESFPVESSETRAARRAMRHLASHLPPARREEEDAIERATETLSARIIESKQRVKARELEINTPAQMIAAPTNPADPYNVGDEARTVRRVEGVSATDVTEPVADLGARVPPPTPVAAPEPASEPTRTPSELFKIPFGMGQARVGALLHTVSTDDLRDARQWAMQNGKFSEFVEVAGILLDDRTNAQAQG